MGGRLGFGRGERMNAAPGLIAAGHTERAKARNGVGARLQLRQIYTVRSRSAISRFAIRLTT